MKKVLTAIWGYFKRLDIILLLLCITASIFSVILLYTLFENDISSRVLASHYKMQFFCSIAGVVGALIISAFDYHFISKMWFIYGPLALIFSLLLFTPLGITPSGSDDIGWLNLGFITFQPSEILKVAFILTFSTHLSKVGKRMNQLPQFLLLCAHGIFPVLLVSAQGDDGSALVFLCMFVIMMFVAGVNWKYILAGVVITPGVVLFAWNFLMQPFHRKRFQVLFDPVLQQAEAGGLYYQQAQSKIAIGTGGLTGLGLTGGTYTNVPAIQTDFIFSYIGMTLGFIGCIMTIILLGLICAKILSVSIMSRDPLGRNICIGVFAMIIFHVVINIGMALAVIPIIGIPLPFISAGGTSVISLYASIGLVFSVYAHRIKDRHMFFTEKD